MLIDSHCHLQDRKFDKDREDVLQRARDAGVTGFVVVGYDVASSKMAVEMADDRSDVHAVVGVHPHDAKTLTPKDIDTLDRLADSAKVVAIGEIGLDLYRNLSPREEQERAFREQLDLARSLKVCAGEAQHGVSFCGLHASPGNHHRQGTPLPDL